MRFNAGIRGWAGAGDALFARLRTILRGSTSGLVVGSPTGGDKGAGSVNAVSYFVGGAALPFSREYDSGDLTITSGGAHTLTHGLGGVPRSVVVIAKCASAEGGYEIGEEAPIGAGENSDTSSTGRGVSIIQNATQIKVRFGNDTNAFIVINATSGDRAQITNTNWRLIVRAYR